MAFNKLLLLFLIVVLTACSTTQDRIAKSKQDYCSIIPKSVPVSLSNQLAQITENREDKTGVYVLEQADEAMVSRAWLTEHAEHTIDVQYFIFSPDNIGLIAVDYLVRAADRGVKVRILVDDIMIQATGAELARLDSHKNLSIKIYNPNLNIGKNIVEKFYNLTVDFHGINQRMHNKTLTIDNKVVITGGRNIADEYFGFDQEYNFRDRDVLLIGGIASDIQKSFDQYWNDSLSVPVSKLINKPVSVTENDSFETLHQYVCNPENFLTSVRERVADIPDFFSVDKSKNKVEWLDNVLYVSDKPGKNNAGDFLGGGGATTDKLVSMLKKAKRTVVIQTPYLVTTDLGKGLLKDLVDRGVEVKILTNSLASTDNLEAFSGYQRDRKRLLKTGVRIFEFRPNAKIRQKIMAKAVKSDVERYPIFGLHAKTMVVDDYLTVIGTFNFDPRSANLNTEGITIIPSKTIAASVKQGIEEELKPENAWETTLNWNPDGETSMFKQLKVKLRRVVPKGIL